MKLKVQLLCTIHQHNLLMEESLVLAVLALAAHWYDIDDWNQYGVEAAIPPHVQTLIAQHRLLRL